MKATAPPRDSQRRYRVDTFIVPESAREEFLEKVRESQVLLQQQQGFLQDFVLERASNSREFHLITIVEWQNQQAVDDARKAVTAFHQSANFNPEELFERLGIRAQREMYTTLYLTP